MKHFNGGIEHIKEDFVVIGKNVLNYFIIGATVEKKTDTGLAFICTTSRSLCAKELGACLVFNPVFF